MAGPVVIGCTQQPMKPSCRARAATAGGSIDSSFVPAGLPGTDRHLPRPNPGTVVIDAEHADVGPGGVRERGAVPAPSDLDGGTGDLGCHHVGKMTEHVRERTAGRHRPHAVV